MDTYRIDKEKLEGYRSSEGLTISAIANAAGINEKRIYEWCSRGGCKIPMVKRIATIVKAPRWYEILTPQECEEERRKECEDLEKSPAKIETKIPIIMQHRLDPMGDEYFCPAFKSNKRVLYITIMTQHGFGFVKENLTPATKLDVLTWDPETKGEVMGWCKQEAEQQDKVKQVDDALQNWDKIAEAHPNVTVRTYDSTPTMQGIIVGNDWAKIEMLTFKTGTASRCALLMRSSEESERRAFRFFADRFRDLWNSGKARVPGTPARCLT